jgi:hypothetical protein
MEKDITLFDCTYCGIMAKARDHIIPVSYSCVDRSLATWERDEIVPACQECNNLLSNRWIPSINGRASYIADKLTFRYEDVLKTPSWDDYELENVSYSLQKMIKARLSVQKDIQARIAFARMVALTQTVPTDVWEVQDTKKRAKLVKELVSKQEEDKKDVDENQLYLRETEKRLQHDLYLLDKNDDSAYFIYSIGDMDSIKNFVGCVRHFRTVLYSLRTKARDNTPLGRDIRRQGIDNFRVRILDACEGGQEAHIRLHFYRNLLESEDPALGYNTECSKMNKCSYRLAVADSQFTSSTS